MRFFDGMFLSDATGTVLYQDEDSSPRLNRFGTEKPRAASEKAASGKEAKAPEAKSDESASLLAAADETTFTRSGVTYKVFTRPVRLPLPLRRFDQTTPQPDLEWILGGFVRQDRFNRETRALPASLVRAVPFLLLLVVLAWPALKLWSLDSRERIRWFDVHLLALCTVLGVAWMTVGAVHLYARYQIRARVDDDLVRLSRKLTHNLLADLRDAHAHLATFIAEQDGSIEAAVKKAEAEANQKGRATCETGEAKNKPKNKLAKTADGKDVTQLLTSPLAEKFQKRPYFDMLLWADSKGDQHAKWTILDANTPHINMSEVDVFRQTKSGTLDVLPVGSNAPRFALQVFPSPLTHKAIPALARPVYPCERLSPKGTPKFVYAAIVPHLRSVIDPVLPLDYGFAVIKPNGAVLLHSDSSRNTRENFYHECETGLPIQSSVELAHADRFDMRYHGLDHRMLVTPLPNLDLSLVVFHDETMLGTLEAEMLTSSSVMLIACILLYLASVAVALVLVVASSTRADSLVLAVVFAVVLLMFVLPRVGGRRSQRALVWGYCGLWVSIIVLVAVMPSLAIFKDAYGHATETLVRAGQVRLAQELARRGETVAKRYAPVASKHDLVQPALAYSRDVYMAPSLLGQTMPYRGWKRPPVDDGADDPVVEAGIFPTLSLDPLLKDTCFERNNNDDEECRLFTRHPAGLVSSFFPLYDDVAARLRRLAYERAADRRWSTALRDGSEEQPPISPISWTRGTRRTLYAAARNVRYGYYTHGDERSAWMTLSSEVPSLAMPRAPLAWFVLAAFAALWLLFAVRLVRWLANALFGLEAWYEDGTSDRDETRNAEQPEARAADGRMKILKARAARAWRWLRGGAQVRLDRLLKDECGGAEPLQAIAARIRARADATALTREQVIELIGDLAEPYYKTLWQSLEPRAEARIRAARAGRGSSTHATGTRCGRRTGRDSSAAPPPFAS